MSLSQTRFALANFCLSRFGADGQYYADVIELCVDASRLQEALDSIVTEVGKRCPDRHADPGRLRARGAGCHLLVKKCGRPTLRRRHLPNPEKPCAPLSSLPPPSPRSA